MLMDEFLLSPSHAGIVRRSIILVLVNFIILAAILFGTSRLEQRNNDIDNDSETNVQDVPVPAILQTVDLEYDIGLNGYCMATYPIEEFYPKPETESTLLNVQIIARHGDRTPCNALPVEDVFWDCEGVKEFRSVLGSSSYINYIQDNGLKHKNLLNGTCRLCQLTIHGFAQLYHIGRSISKIYSPLINLSTKTVYARSTSIDRTRQSAQAFLAGLFGQFSSFPISCAHDEIYDMLIPTTEYCPRLAEIAVEMEESAEWKEIHPNNNPIMSQLNNICKTNNLNDWQKNYDHFFDMINSRLCHNLSLPCFGNECLSLTLAESFNNLAIKEFNLIYGGFLGKEKTKLESSFFVNTLVQNLLLKTNRTVSSPNLYLFSAHDGTIGMMLSALNATNTDKRPAYASNIILELWQPINSNQERFIRVLHNGQLIIPAGCRNFECPLSNFVDYANINLISSNYTESCQLKNSTRFYPTSSTEKKNKNI
eukprot:c16254_g1_i1.p1 GENE.c16254_g1_i1~~c16254_g1_i1.p1  ORF type:complete len:481 (-),score=165.97 c16254_g1_i1:116-1558(-)